MDEYEVIATVEQEAPGLGKPRVVSYSVESDRLREHAAALNPPDWYLHAADFAGHVHALLYPDDKEAISWTEKAAKRAGHLA